MKFNLGCGRRKLQGYVNVDSWAGCEPDEVWDLDRTPWPWESDCATEVLFIHALEHIGATTAGFLAIMSELYRIAAPGCVVQIHVPHPRHDHFLGDPTHVRPITPQVLALFDRELNDKWVASNAANSPLAHHLGVDFKIVRTNWVLDPVYREKMAGGEISQTELNALIRERNNVVQELQFTLEVRKG